MMYATIRRYESIAASLDDMALAGHRLGIALSRTPGFVAALAVERGRSFVTISLFEDESSLVAANALADSWSTEHRDQFDRPPAEVITGEIVAQRGL